jgi:Alpha galactosidase A/Alpha galactosidase C-terminal beta sandwich domain/Divergent InlB B-repeat domain
LKSWIRRALVSIAVGLSFAVASAGTATALSSTPYMGWNTYYGLGRVFDQGTITSVAQSLLDRGLAQAGYRIVWLDAGWASGARDAGGQIIVDHSLWPNGLPWLTSWLHQRGLLAGIYTDAGATGCSGIGVGSLGHYQQDVDTFAAWGFDAVKVDFCGAGQAGLTPRTQYTQFAQALANNASQRPMIFNVDNFWEPGQVNGAIPSFANSAYANYQYAPAIAQSWRTDTDVGFGHGGGVAFSDVLRNLDADAAHPEVAGPGHWNDPDYLGPELGMTSAQAQAQMSMWAIVAAPLIIGSDPRALSPAAIGMLENSQVIAIDQDPAGAQGTPVAQLGPGQVWARPLSNGDRAVALLNRGSSPLQVGVLAWDAGLAASGNYRLTDVWSGATTATTGRISASLAGSSAALYRVTALAPAAWYTLHMSLAGSGAGRVTSDPRGISCPASCSVTVGQGVPVVLTTTPEPGSRFAGWSGSGCYGTGPCVVTMGADQSVTATFTAVHTLSVSRTGSGKGTVASNPGGISCPTTCSANFDHGVPLTLRAKAKSGSAFAGWSGAGCSLAGSCVARLRSNQTLTAKFAGSTGFGPPVPTKTGVLESVWCAAPPGHNCPFTETLTTVETIAAGKVATIRAARKPAPGTSTVIVGKRGVKVSGGHAITRTIELNPTGRALLKQFGNVPVTLTIQLLRKGKLVTLGRRKLTIRPKKAHKKASSGPTSSGGTKTSSRSVLGALRLDWPLL